MPDFKEEKILDRTFGKCLDVLLFVDGARAPGSKKKSGECWTVAEFADAVSVDEKTVRNWLFDKKTPRYLHAIEKALFGIENLADPRNAALREAHRRARPRRSNEAASDVLISARQSLSHFGTGSPNAILHLDIRPVPGFIGREDLLAGIDAALWQKGESAALTNSSALAAVKGLGGVGKSVLAREYAWRNRERYRGVWWVRAETTETITDDLIDLGSRLIPNLKEVPERDRAVHLALDAIAGSGAGKPWLILYDNAESPNTLAKLTPATCAHLIITSRWSDWYGHAEARTVDVFRSDVAVAYLMEHTRHPDREAAARLAEALGYLPLALSHARAYCWLSNLDFDSYQARLSELIRKAPRGAAYPDTVFATFDLAIEKAVAICPNADLLMNIGAFLAPDHIPTDLITDAVMSESERDDALAALNELSLITHQMLPYGTRAFSVHRLVQEVTRARLGEQADKILVLTMALIIARLPDDTGDHMEWPRVEELLPHALWILRHASNDGEQAKYTSALSTLIGTHLKSRAAYYQAEPHYERALAIDEKDLGPNHPSTGVDFNNLAMLYQEQGRYEAAEPLYKRAVDITERALGPDHAQTGTSLNNFALLYIKQGQHEKAGLLLKRAISIREKALGPDHSHVGTSLNNLGSVYHAQGKYDDAEALFERAIELAEKNLGPNHPTTATRLNNLATLYSTQGQHSRAEPLLKRALDITENTLGPDHPETGTSLNNLASVYQTQGKYDDAEPLYERALDITEKALGPSHPTTGQSVTVLARLYLAQGRYEEAVPLFKRAFAKIPGPDIS